MIVVQAMVAVAALRLILRDGSSLCAFRSLPLLGRVPQSGLAALCIVALLVDLLLIAWLLYTMNRLRDHRQCRDIRHNGCRRCHREQI